MSHIARMTGFPPGGVPAWALAEPPAWQGFAASAPSASANWWSSSAVLAADFTGGRYMRNGVEVAFPDILSTARNSEAAGFGTDGVCRSFAANEPVLLPGRGLDIRGQHTNYLGWTQNFAQVSTGWSIVKSGGTGLAPVRTPGIAGPDGASTAQRIFFDKGAGTSGGDYSQYGQQVGVSGSDSVNLVIWARSADGGNHTLFWSDTGVSSGTVETFEVTPEWRRFNFITYRSGRSVARFTIGLRGDLATSQAANVDLWEPGLIGSASEIPFPVPSAGAGAASRLATLHAVPGFADLVAAHGLLAGLSVRLKFTLTHVDGAVRSIAEMHDGGAGERLMFRLDSDNRFKLIHRNDAAGEDAAVMVQSDPLVPGVYDILARAKSGSWSLGVNGATVSTSPVLRALPPVSQCQIGAQYGGAASFFNDTISCLDIRRAS